MTNETDTDGDVFKNPGGRPRNDSRYPVGLVFDAQALRFALSAQDISLRDLIARLDAEQGIRVHRATVWRWTQHNLYPRPNSGAPPLTSLRALEAILGVPLLKEGTP